MTWVKSAATATGVLAVLAAACFALQAGALGRPGAAEIELVHTLSVLHGRVAVPSPRAPSRSTVAEICGADTHLLASCPNAIVRWFGRELRRGAAVVRQRVEIEGRRRFALRVRHARPPLELVVAGSGYPIGLALAAPEEHAEGPR
jgi:hypothetical protein